ncbi:MAG: alpha/beta hydrolase [Pseudomonadota bacterium]
MTRPLRLTAASIYLFLLANLAFADQDDRTVIKGQVNDAQQTLVLNSSPPPISDGWSVSEHQDDVKVAVDPGGEFRAEFVASASFHRLSLADRTVEVFAPPGSEIEVKIPGADGAVTFSGQHAAENRLLQASLALLTDREKEISDDYRAFFAADYADFSRSVTQQQDEVRATIAGLSRSDKLLHDDLRKRIDVEIQSAFDNLRLYYPGLYREITEKSVPAENDYFLAIAESRLNDPRALWSPRFIRFIDKIVQFESAGPARFDHRDKPREKLLSRYQTIDSLSAAADIKNYLYGQMFNTFQVNYGPADWERVLVQFEQDYPAHPLLATVKAQHREEMAERERADRIEIFRQVDGVDLEAHIFLPKGHKAGDQRPVLLTFHGGGWAIGTPEWSYTTAEKLAAQGMVAVSFEYRIADVHGSNMFNAIEDVKAAVRWARENAVRLGIDPDRVVAGGFSAGAHLAGASAILSADDPSEADSRPNALILHSSTYNTGKSSFFEAMTDGQAKKVSLFHNVQSGLVPAILFHGKYDYLAPETEFLEFVGRMEELNNPFGHHLFEVGHFFRNDEARKRVDDLTLRFLTQNGMLDPAE